MNGMRNIIVGAGLTGAVLANLIAIVLKEKVLIIDKRDTIAGNIYDEKDSQTGIIVHKYGPHIFHTNNEKVWAFLSKYTEWYDFSFMPNAYINGKFVNIPFNINTIYQLFPSEKAQKLEEKLIREYGYDASIPLLEMLKNPDNDISFISNYIYEYMFKNYTIKQWGFDPKEIDKSITARVPIRISKDNRYFTDKYQGIPLNGYTKMVENILNHPNITIKLNTDFKFVSGHYDRIFYTGSIDEYFDYKYGELPYRSLEFDVREIDKEYYQKSAMTNYPNDYDFTRIVEHKHFLNTKSDKTIITMEYPKQFVLNKNERFYPIAKPENQELYDKYMKEANKIKGLYFIGRLGAYKYLNMDQAVENVFEFFENRIKGELINA
ncbi:UDP-galactopyranose mutase [bacterium]|nr:UDP-galactopyranose mutase [bacterium]